MFIKYCYYPYYHPIHYSNYPFYQNCADTPICSQTATNGYIATYDEVAERFKEWRDCENTIRPPGTVCMDTCWDEAGLVTSCCTDQYCKYVKARDSWNQQFKTKYQSHF
ncbi:TPA: hypothetical protein ACTZ3H_005346 [Bacillus cereus]